MNELPVLMGADRFEEKTYRERSMPLMRGRIVGYDADQMTFKFTMMHEARIVDCEISSIALDDLAGERGVRPGEREAQFKLLRDVIERVASDIFDKRGEAKGEAFRIFAKHIRNR
ncbi:DUF1488 family protein [Bradyrhizobium sp.]|uniref:DUF1488 family protein n=1 Tax=Bradyrhizobium sp. TaxID=376 RepID=UPI003C771076